LVNLNALARSLGKVNLTESQLADLPAMTVCAALTGDKTALNAVNSIVHHLIRGISALVNIFNPATIILGGIMLPVFKYCLEKIRLGISSGLVPGIPVPEVQLSKLVA
jgi:predicted NBD/HSP70 family sugar kinase